MSRNTRSSCTLVYNFLGSMWRHKIYSTQGMCGAGRSFFRIPVKRVPRLMDTNSCTSAFVGQWTSSFCSGSRRGDQRTQSKVRETDLHCNGAPLVHVALSDLQSNWWSGLKGPLSSPRWHIAVIFLEYTVLSSLSS